MIDANVSPVPVRLVCDTHVPTLSEMVVEIKTDHAPVRSTAAVVEPCINTSDDESTDPLASVREYGFVARTAYTWIASDCSTVVQLANIGTHGLQFSQVPLLDISCLPTPSNIFRQCYHRGRPVTRA